MITETLDIEKKIVAVPKLRFKGFNEEWKIEKLETRISKIDSGWSPQCEEFPSKENEWGVLKTTSVVWEGFNESANKKLPEKLQPKPELEVAINDILITRAGPTSRVGVTVHVNKVRPKLMISDKIIRLRSNENCSSLFLAISLSNHSSQKQLVSKSSGLAESQTNISQRILLNTRLFFPSFPEQQKIASFLSVVDEKIQQLSRKKELLEQYKKGVMQQLFSGKLRFKDKNGKNYPDWEKKKLGEVFQVFRGNGISKDKLSEDGANACILYGELYTKYKEVISNVLSRTDLKKGVLSEIGDLLIPSSTTTTGIDLANVTALNEKNVLLGGDITILRTKRDISNVFFAYYLTNYKKFEIAAFAQGSTIVHLSYNHFKVLNISFPIKEEQNKIANFLSSIDTKIESTTKQITQTQTFKKGLLQQMFA